MSLQRKILLLTESTDFITDAKLITTHPWPKTDLLHWVPVLNRIDALLEQPESDKDVEICLVLSLLIWENTTNRGIYASYDRLVLLAAAPSLSVTVAALKFLLKPAQRPQRVLRQSLMPLLPTLLVTAIKHKHSQTITFSFYREIIEDLTELQDSNINSNSSLTPLPKKQRIDTPDQALVSIQHTVDGPSDESTVIQLWKSLIDKYNVPKNKQFELLHRIRISSFYNDTVRMQLLLKIRFFSIAILGTKFY